MTGAPISFTADGGLHRAPVETPAPTNYFTYGVAALTAGSTLAAVVGTTAQGDSAQIFFSTDAGCSWQPSGQTLPDVHYYLDAALTAAAGYAYAWSTNNRSVHVIAPTGIARPLRLDFASWVSGPYGLAIDANDPERIRVSMYDCLHRASCGHGAVIMQTTDEGATWTRIGTPAPAIALEMRFSPINLDHVVAPSAGGAVHVTFDGGNQWLNGQGIPSGWNAQEAAIGPDGQTVWLLADTGSSSSAPNPSALYVSYDGGLNYQEALAASAANPFAARNSIADTHARARLFPHASNADVVYLAYTSRAAGASYLYRYDADLGQLTSAEWAATDGGIWSLAFNPADPQVLYLGLSAAE